MLTCLVMSSLNSPNLAFSQENSFDDLHAEYVEITERADIFNNSEKVVGEINPGTQLNVETIQDGKVYFQWDENLVYIQEISTKNVAPENITFTLVGTETEVTTEEFLTHNPTEVYADSTLKTPILKIAPEVQYSITKMDNEYYSITVGNREGFIRSGDVELLSASIEPATIPLEKNSILQESAPVRISAPEPVSATAQVSAVAPSIFYTTHVQNIGWLQGVSDGALSGTVGKALHLEAVQISLKNTPISGGISYKTHVQDLGWLASVSNGQTSGTTGKNKQVEAIQMNLTGQMAEQYDVYYRVHSETFGWLGWAKNGESAGTEGLSKQLEAIEILLVAKGGQAPGSTDKPFLTKPSVSYSSHVENIGWLNPVENGKMSGTQGQGLRLEAIKVSLGNSSLNGGISYKTHVQDLGWLESVNNGEISGTTGNNKQVEAIQMNLTGQIAEYYDVYYRVYSETFGWLDWAKNGESAGTESLNKQLEAFEVVLIAKNGQPPGSTTKPFLTTPSVVYSTHVENYGWMNTVANGQISGTEGKSLHLEAIRISLKNAPFTGEISYKTLVQDYGWLANVSNGETSGTTGKNKQVEAIQMNLTGNIAEHYDVYYRVHAENYGWLDWAKNGKSAGTQGLSLQLEAIEIVLVAKGGTAPGSTNNPFIIKPSVVYSTHVQDYGWLASVSDGKTSGTQGQLKRMEAIKISLNNAYPGDITYSTHVQDYGWLNSVSNGAISGTSGQSKRLEAIKINLTGEMAQHYDIYYRVHAEMYGWLDWAKNGESAGTKGLSKRLEAIEIILVAKGGAAPGLTTNPYIQSDLTNYYNITLTEALNMQMKATPPPQTDKYRTAPAYVNSQDINVFKGGSITGSSVNLRRSSTIVNSDNIEVNVGKGTLFKVLDDNVTGDMVSGSTRWYKIEYKGKILYVHSSLASSNLRVGQATGASINVMAEKSAGSHIYATVKNDTLLNILEENTLGWHRVSIGAWRNATSSDVLPNLDPTNFINDENQRFQFMDLTKTSGLSPEALNNYLVGKGILTSRGQAFIDAGSKYGLNEVYLLAHSMLETGHGKSELANGVYHNGQLVFNMYGIGANDSCPIECGAKKAFENGWFTPYDAIVGGAAFIADGYANGKNIYKVVQNTLYEMRWNPEVMATKGVAGHQYASDMEWASKQVTIMSELYKIQPFPIFLEIPVYK
jgi:uncharacterized protein YjdB/beta-N-acetylglucosaminidase